MTVHFGTYRKDDGWQLEPAATKFQYPGGELHLKDIVDDVDRSTVWIAIVRGADVNDLVYAGLLADVAHHRQAPFVLMLPYFPAARADHVESLDPLGVRVYGQMITSFNPQQIITIDLHSPVADRYTRKLTELTAAPLVERALGTSHPRQYDAVIAPDKGAVGRASGVAADLGVDLYIADKKRDFDTGKILGIEMTEPLPKTGRYLVVDDICDGGGTFMGLANAIDLPKDQLGLWVTHGIFSGNAHLLRDHYRNIYTTDSHPGNNRVGVATMVVPTMSYMFQNLQKEFG